MKIHELMIALAATTHAQTQASHIRHKCSDTSKAKKAGIIKIDTHVILASCFLRMPR